jgi:hypothetical protein
MPTTPAWKIELEGLLEMQKQTTADIRNLQGAAVLQGYRDAALKILAEAKKGAKVDTGRWRASMLPFVELSGNVIEAGVGSNLDHGPFAELDTKPHWAPLQPLIEWVHRKRLAGVYSLKKAHHGIHPRLGSKVTQAAQDYAVARAVQRKIAKYGTKGDHAMERGLDKALPYIERRLERAYAEALRE